MMKTIEKYTVRNSSGQYVATYSAYSSKEAITKFLRDQAAYSSVFRQNVLKKDAWTATVENENIDVA